MTTPPHQDPWYIGGTQEVWTAWVPVGDCPDEFGGIAVLPCFIADAVPNLQRVFQERVGVNSGWIVYHESLRDTARLRVVVDALVACFERHAAMFSGLGEPPGAGCDAA